jgi:hypothetical protein
MAAAVRAMNEATATSTEAALCVREGRGAGFIIWISAPVSEVEEKSMYKYTKIQSTHHAR